MTIRDECVEAAKAAMLDLSAKAALAVSVDAYAIAALDAILKRLSEPDEGMVDAGLATECEHGDQNCGAEVSFRAMLATIGTETVDG